MIEALDRILREHPISLLFVILGVGYLLRLNPAVLLGAITGAMTSAAALSVVNSAARSSVPALGYTGAYAFANVILTLAGTLIVRL